MSPFEESAERIGSLLSSLSARGQVALAVCTSRVLTSHYREWCAERGLEDHSDLLLEAQDGAARFATGDDAPCRQGLLADLEEATPSDQSGGSTFTAIQNGWICADIAIRIQRDEFAIEQSAWYLLEPTFQAVSERLFGVTDVGSREQDTKEAEALRHPDLVAALRGLEDAAALLAGLTDIRVRDLRELEERLRPLGV